MERIVYYLIAIVAVFSVLFPRLGSITLDCSGVLVRRERSARTLSDVER